jgi:hypothetical protein
MVVSTLLHERRGEVCEGRSGGWLGLGPFGNAEVRSEISLGQSLFDDEPALRSVRRQSRPGDLHWPDREPWNAQCVVLPPPGDGETG